MQISNIEHRDDEEALCRPAQDGRGRVFLLLDLQVLRAAARRPLAPRGAKTWDPERRGEGGPVKRTLPTGSPEEEKGRGTV